MSLTALITSIKTPQVARAGLLTCGVILPWFVGIALGEAQYGSIASFASYLLVVSFPSLPARHTFRQLLIAACLFCLFATIGSLVSLGSVAFFIPAVMAALAQSLGELRGGFLRLPVALSALAFFLSVGQLPSGGWLAYSLFFSSGAAWGLLLARLLIPFAGAETSSPASPGKLPLSQQGRYTLSMVTVSLLGSLIACFAPGSHPCWLPAAGLRVMKPTRDQTVYRMKTRSAGTLLGAMCAGLLLGLSAYPWLHAIIAAGMLFAMLLIGARRYGCWTFCLTAIALAFNLNAESSLTGMAVNRTLLTLVGISLALMTLWMLPKKSCPPASDNSQR